MADGKRTAIVEDDFLIAEYLRSLCEDMAVPVVGFAATADDAVAMLRETRPDYLLLDVRLSGKRDGLDVSKEIREELPSMKIIFVTASADPMTMVRMSSQRPHRLLMKPINPAALEDAFE